MPRVVHFEIHATNPETVVQFYQAVFNWKISQWEGGNPDYWLISTGDDNLPGINGGLLRRRGDPPTDSQVVNSFVCTVDVPDLDDYLRAVQHHGGTIAVPQTEIPGIGWLAYAKDPDGNLFGLMQPTEIAE